MLGVARQVRGRFTRMTRELAVFEANLSNRMDSTDLIDGTGPNQVHNEHDEHDAHDPGGGHWLSLRCTKQEKQGCPDKESSVAGIAETAIEKPIRQHDHQDHSQHFPSTNRRLPLCSFPEPFHGRRRSTQGVGISAWAGSLSIHRPGLGFDKFGSLGRVLTAGSTRVGHRRFSTLVGPRARADCQIL